MHIVLRVLGAVIGVPLLGIGMLAGWIGVVGFQILPIALGGVSIGVGVFVIVTTQRLARQYERGSS